MFGNSDSLRHLPFFEEVAIHEEHQAAWRAASAGLVTLRLFDTWIEEGAEAVAPNSWTVRAVLKAIDQMDDGAPTRAILRTIVSTMQASQPADVHDVMPRLLAYARSLEYDANWKLAVDVYDAVIAHTHPVQESDTAVTAHQQRGFCLRTMGEFEQALDAYATAAGIAEQSGDMIGVLRAKIGDANVAAARGNLPYADRAFDAIAQEAAILGLAEPQARALDGRAAVAGFRGDHELAIRFAYDALRISPDTSERDRILSNIGTAFHMLGIRSVARDAFLVLSATAQEQYTRWAATLSLMTIAAEDGSEPAFDQLRRTLSTASMPPDMTVDYFIHLGRAHRELQHDDLADIAFAKAIQLAEHHGLSRHLFEAEGELRVKSAKARRESVPTPSAVVDVADAVRDLRVHMLQEQA